MNYHRNDQGLARGPSLPVPADPLCLFAGHHKLYGTGSLALDKLCLGHGCSAWDRQKAQRLDELPTCTCGLEAPSRPHLLWACAHFSQCTAAVGAPRDRVQERLLGCVVPEWPAPPPVLDTDGIVEDLSEALRAAWSSERPWLLLATDGSCHAEVASYSVVVDHGASVAAGVEGEDQTSYKAELCALALLVRAALCLELVGTLWVVVDCKSLLDAITGRGALSSLVMQISAGIAVLSSRGLLLKLEWVPSHDKPLPPGWVASSGATEAHLRALNARADRVARQHCGRRCQLSARLRCHAAREAAQRWEDRAGKVEGRVDDHGSRLDIVELRVEEAQAYRFLPIGSSEALDKVWADVESGATERTGIRTAAASAVLHYQPGRPGTSTFQVVDQGSEVFWLVAMESFGAFCLELLCGAAATKRKRIERLLTSLAGLLFDWAGDEGDEQTAKNAECEQLFEQIVPWLRLLRALRPPLPPAMVLLWLSALLGRTSPLTKLRLSLCSPCAELPRDFVDDGVDVWSSPVIARLLSMLSVPAAPFLALLRSLLHAELAGTNSSQRNAAASSSWILSQVVA
ncbi:CHLP [Symbiodinium sp. CCMP2592]|nr:CHLP [Symbiodinium sp. CCMP2592]